MMAKKPKQAKLFVLKGKRRRLRLGVKFKPVSVTGSVRKMAKLMPKPKQKGSAIYGGIYKRR